MGVDFTNYKDFTLHIAKNKKPPNLKKGGFNKSFNILFNVLRDFLFQENVYLILRLHEFYE